MYEPVLLSIKKNSYEISGWFEKHLKRIPVPFLASVVIKDSGFKTTISGINFFPLGLNHIAKADLRNTPQLVKKYFKKYHSDIEKLKKILVLATVRHSNPFYYEHLFTLVQILKKSSLKVELGTLEMLDVPSKIKTPSKKTLKIFPVTIESDRIRIGKFDPDFVLLTDPFTSDLTLKLANLRQSMNPPYKVLSFMHKRSDSLNIFNTLAKDFSDLIGIDPWLISTQFHVDTHVNFEEKSGVEKVANSTNILLQNLEQKYREYKVIQRPSVQIVNNSGTYGMGMLSIQSTKELSELYFKKKAKRTNGKSQSVINEVLIQESVPVRPLFNKFVGETVIYLLGNEISGGYIKTYTDKTAKNVLSSRELLFQPVGLTRGTVAKVKKQTDKTLGLLYQNLSRLGGLAAGYEIDRIR